MIIVSTMVYIANCPRYDKPTRHHVGDGFPADQGRAAELSVHHAPDPFPVLNRERLPEPQLLSESVVLILRDNPFFFVEDPRGNVTGENPHRPEYQQRREEESGDEEKQSSYDVSLHFVTLASPAPLINHLSAYCIGTPTYRSTYASTTRTLAGSG